MVQETTNWNNNRCKFMYEFQILAAETTKQVVLTYYYPAGIQVRREHRRYIFCCI